MVTDNKSDKSGRAIFDSNALGLFLLLKSGKRSAAQKEPQVSIMLSTKDSPMTMQSAPIKQDLRWETVIASPREKPIWHCLAPCCSVASKDIFPHTKKLGHIITPIVSNPFPFIASVSTLGVKLTICHNSHEGGAHLKPHWFFKFAQESTPQSCWSLLSQVLLTSFN